MKTALIITLGSRDIQLDAELPTNVYIKKTADTDSDVYSDKNFPGVLFLKSARKHGQIIWEHFDFFSPYLLYPIVRPAIEYLKQFSQFTSRELIIVHTDQERTNPEKSAGDTLWFAHIIEKLVQKDFPELFRSVHYIKVEEHVTEYDTMYDFFTEKFKRSPFRDYDRNAQIFLLPQGGIDQINTALLFKCMEEFPHMVQLSKPERSSPVEYDRIIPLKFNQRFYTAINKKKIVHALEHFYYHLINEELTADRLILLYAAYASARLGLHREDAQSIREQLLTEERNGWAQHNLLPLEDDTFSLQKEYYLALKIALRQKNYTDFVIRLSSLHQSMLKKFISDKYGIPIPETRDEAQEAWNKILESNDELRNYLSNCRTNRGQPIYYQEPSASVFQIVFNHFAQGDERRLTPLFRLMEKANDIRNRAAHQLKPVLNEDIDGLFDNRTAEEILRPFDNYFEVRGFGVYDSLNEKIGSLLK